MASFNLVWLGSAMDNAVPLLELKNITKSFSGTRVLEDVNLKIYPGEIVGLIGGIDNLGSFIIVLSRPIRSTLIESPE